MSKLNNNCNPKTFSHRNQFVAKASSFPTICLILKWFLFFLLLIKPYVVKLHLMTFSANYGNETYCSLHENLAWAWKLTTSLVVNRLTPRNTTLMKKRAQYFFVKSGNFVGGSHWCFRRYYDLSTSLTHSLIELRNQGNLFCAHVLSFHLLPFLFPSIHFLLPFSRFNFYFYTYGNAN